MRIARSFAVEIPVEVGPVLERNINIVGKSFRRRPDLRITASISSLSGFFCISDSEDCS